MIAGEVTEVLDNHPWCWDVLLDFGDSALATLWPRDFKPPVGARVLYCDHCVFFRGLSFAVDVLKMTVDGDNNVTLE